MNRNKASLANNRIKRSIAAFSLCLYLFVMFVTSVLHPLYHCHEGHSCHLATDIKGHHEEDISSYCVFCHTYILHQIVTKPSSNVVFIDVCETLYKEYFCNHYSSGYSADKHSRAPPSQIV